MSGREPEPADRLYVITDRASADAGLGSVDAVVEEALGAGAERFQFRDKERAPVESLELGRRLAARWTEAGAEFLVNGRADLAACLGADGVHRPGGGLPVDCLRGVLGSGAVVAASTHDLEELREAERAGADFATLSPVFRSPSKPHYGPPLGVETFGALVGEVELPVFALGGVTPERVERCVEAGASGVAVMSGVMASQDPRGAVRDYLEALSAARPAARDDNSGR